MLTDSQGQNQVLPVSNFNISPYSDNEEGGIMRIVIGDTMLI